MLTAQTCDYIYIYILVESKRRFIEKVKWKTQKGAELVRNKKLERTFEEV